MTRQIASKTTTDFSDNGKQIMIKADKTITKSDYEDGKSKKTVIDRATILIQHSDQWSTRLLVD